MPSDAPASARNWWVVLAFDLAIGLALLAGGLWLGGGLGALLVALAGVELFFAAGRSVKWRRIRRQRGLDR